MSFLEMGRTSLGNSGITTTFYFFYVLFCFSSSHQSTLLTLGRWVSFSMQMELQ